jgi:hypothetical protein
MPARYTSAIAQVRIPTAELGVTLHPGDRGFQQVRKQKRQKENEESAARQVEDSGRDREDRYGRNRIPSPIVD